ncbi:histidine phosphatase family protein [Erysipelothrix urinaevulpis]|uniref:histidine phosphatase family protein n=1 Tax=Erysipelothrix urinaevulpis TaxID=2683717 RepID=UPI00135A6926|nr:histidine phosphatase family protein [Erysipelothrix urinaevulpis]
MKKVYLVRHGETLFNYYKKMQGFSDSPLTKDGIQQAGLAKQYFEEQNILFDAVYASTSERTHQTLEIITDQPYTRLKGIKEWNFGSLEGESVLILPTPFEKDFFVQFGGEHREDFSKRVLDTIHDIVETSSASSILIVVHGGVIFEFYQEWLNHSEIRLKDNVKNCSIFDYTYSDNVYTLENIIEHDLD